MSPVKMQGTLSMLIGVPNLWVNFQTSFTSINGYLSFLGCFCSAKIKYYF